MKKRVLFASLAAYPLFNRKIHEPFCGAELDLYTIATHLDTSKFDVHFLVADYGQPREYGRVFLAEGEYLSAFPEDFAQRSFFPCIQMLIGECLYLDCFVKESDQCVA